MLKILLATSLSFLVLITMPVALSAARYWEIAHSEWWAADRSSAGLLPPARARPDSLVRVYAARTVRWKGIFAIHTWIVLKQGAGPYERYDLTAWGEPIRVNGFVPDGRWFGQVPSVIYAADGTQADALIPRMRAAIAEYKYRNLGDYRAWPGPNSNTRGFGPRRGAGDRREPAIDGDRQGFSRRRAVDRAHAVTHGRSAVARRLWRADDRLGGGS
jgi:hypothetical protein